MIVVRANLYRKRVEQKRRTRPKLLIICGVVLLLGSWLASDVGERRALGGLREQVQAAQRHATGLTRDLEEARATDTKIYAAIARREPILSYAARRQNWAPVLAKVLAAIPPSTELTSVLIQNENAGKLRARLTGRCEGTQPRLEADKCLLQITHAFKMAGLPMQGRFAALEEVERELIGAADKPPIAEFDLEFTLTGEANAN